MQPAVKRLRREAAADVGTGSEIEAEVEVEMAPVPEAAAVEFATPVPVALQDPETEGTALGPLPMAITMDAQFAA